MANDDRDILELFRDELDFIEKGGYGRRVKTPWKPTSIFRDSLSCINYGFSSRVHSCSNCHLFDFVPAEARGESVPCHHIPLDTAGTTIDDLEAAGNQQKLEESVKAWLRVKIAQIHDTGSIGGQQQVVVEDMPGEWMKQSGLYGFDIDRLSKRTSMPLTKPRILYIDEDAENSFTISTLLRLGNFDPVTVNFACDALQFAQTAEFDLYLLARRIPVGQGRFLCEQLHEMSPQTPIVFLTEDKSLTDAEMNSCSGLNTYIVQTRDAHGILDAVNIALAEPAYQTASINL